MTWRRRRPAHSSLPILSNDFRASKVSLERSCSPRRGAELFGSTSSAPRWDFGRRRIVSFVQAEFRDSTEVLLFSSATLSLLACFDPGRTDSTVDYFGLLTISGPPPGGTRFVVSRRAEAIVPRSLALS